MVENVYFILFKLYYIIKIIVTNRIVVNNSKIIQKKIYNHQLLLRNRKMAFKNNVVTYPWPMTDINYY